MARSHAIGSSLLLIALAGPLSLALMWERVGIPGRAGGLAAILGALALLWRLGVPRPERWLEWLSLAGVCVAVGGLALLLALATHVRGWGFEFPVWPLWIVFAGLGAWIVFALADALRPHSNPAPRPPA